MTYGAARDFSDFIYVKASNGIGAALVLNGQLYRGSHGMAGEIGHTQIDPTGAWCRCGNRGCLEATVSIDVVRRQLEPLGLDPLNPADMEHPVATKVLAESGRTVGVVIANLCNTLNPEAVILGGDLASTGAHFTAGVQDSVRHLAQPGPAHTDGDHDQPPGTSRAARGGRLRRRDAGSGPAGLTGAGRSCDAPSARSLGGESLSCVHASHFRTTAALAAVLTSTGAVALAACGSATEQATPGHSDHPRGR